MCLLFVTDDATGFVQVLSFPSLLERGLHMIRIAPQPVTLRLADY
jgi:hypothetical protein